MHVKLDTMGGLHLLLNPVHGHGGDGDGNPSTPNKH